MNKLICGCLVSALALSVIPDAVAWRGGGGGGVYHGAYGGRAVQGPGGNWAAQGPRGSTASGNGHGSWNATGYRGGTASGSNGSWSAHGAYGGTASGGGGSWSATNRYGTTAYGGGGLSRRLLRWNGLSLWRCRRRCGRWCSGGCGCSLDLPVALLHASVRLLSLSALFLDRMPGRASPARELFRVPERICLC